MKDQTLRALAYLVTELHPGWDQPGVHAALVRDLRPLPELAVIAIHAALDSTARTPAVINHRSPCAAVPASTSRPLAPPPVQEVREFVAVSSPESREKWLEKCRESLRVSR